MLVLRTISKTFPGVKALDDVSLQFRPGEIHALVGENGAGKSTLMKIITGIYQPDSGSIEFDGQPLQLRNYRESLARGIDIVHQEMQVIPEISVAESIMLDKLPSISRMGIINWMELERTAQSMMGRVGLAIPASTPMKFLSVAQKQLAQIAKALSADARVLLLDEPTSSLTSHEAGLLFGLLRKLKSAGKTIIFVSHKFEEIFQLCDRVSVLRDGRHIATREIDQLTPDSLTSLMIGRDYVTKPLGESFSQSDAEALRVINLAGGDKVNGCSFTLFKGEILGFYGLVGSGRTELAKLLIGAQQPGSGQIYIEGNLVRIRNVGDALHQHGIAYVTENRKEDGLLLKSDVQTNITLPAWPNLINRLTRKINPRRERALAERMVKELDVRTPSLSIPVENLSGGNQQKISLAKALARDSRILIIDEPTVGVDIGAKEQIHEIIWRLANQQASSVIVISSDMPEIIRLTTRILVFKSGRIVGEVDNTGTSPDRFQRTSNAIGQLMVTGVAA